jgi:hypothetical protein
MKVKMFYACLMILFFTATPLFAQDQSSGDEHQPPSAADIVAKMQSKLDLTQDQVTAIGPIIEKYTSKREDLRQSVQDGTVDRDSIRSQMKQLKTDEIQELSQVLSADQVSQWEQMMSQRRHKQNSDDGAQGSSGSGEGNGEGAGNGGGGEE